MQAEFENEQSRLTSDLSEERRKLHTASARAEKAEAEVKGMA